MTSFLPKNRRFSEIRAAFLFSGAHERKKSAMRHNLRLYPMAAL